ncbi:class I SAM-dependent methyltransferase [Neorhizobium galegae]|nr:class I SAM-dependent methyltransferase [Neorhizobium galegae]
MRLLGRFKALGFNVLGVEPDAAARAEAAKAGVTVLAGTCEELPADLKGQSCDLVIMRHVLEHCRDPILALQKAFFLTRPGGILFCEVPNCAATHFKSLGVCSAMFDAPRHLYFFYARLSSQGDRPRRLHLLQLPIHGLYPPPPCELAAMGGLDLRPDPRIYRPSFRQAAHGAAVDPASSFDGLCLRREEIRFRRRLRAPAGRAEAHAGIGNSNASMRPGGWTRSPKLEARPAPG